MFDQWPRLYLGVDAETETEKRKKKIKKINQSFVQ